MKISAVLVSTVFLFALTAIGCADRRIATVEAFRAARDRGDLDAARTHLAADPRVWYETREGDGMPWTLGAGRWKAWDEHFNSTSAKGPWEVDGDAVSAVFTEMNEYYLLTEKGPSPVRLTWFIDDDGLIEGYLVSAVETGRPSTSRFDEFEAWALENDPDELAYLVPGGKIDPTGDRPPRFRRLLEQWRAAIGEEPPERDSP